MNWLVLLTVALIAGALAILYRSLRSGGYRRDTILGCLVLLSLGLATLTGQVLGGSTSGTLVQWGLVVSAGWFLLLDVFGPVAEWGGRRRGRGGSSMG